MADTKEVGVSAEAKRKDKLAYLKTIGNRALKDEKFEELQKIAQQIIKLDSDDAQAHFWLGLSTHRLGMDSVIIENHYRNAIILNPKMSYAYSNLGILVFQDSNRRNEAKDYFLKAIELDQNNATAYCCLGNIKYVDGSSLNDVEECYRMAIHLNPLFSDAYAGLGGVLLRYEFRNKEAKASYEKAIELDANNASAYEGLGYLYQNDENNLDKAEENFRKALALKPNDSEFYLKLGFFFHKQKRLDETIEVCQKAAMLDETNFVPLLILASVYRNLGYKEESKKYAKLGELIIKKDGFIVNEPNYYNLACLNSILEDKKESVKYLKLAVEKEPNFKSAAKTDPDLDLIRNTSQFKKIIGG